MHCFIIFWGHSTTKLQGQDELRARALECSFFSCVAIGGLLSGCPALVLRDHVDMAHVAVGEIRGLSDRHAVSALILYGMLNMLLPEPGSNAEGKRILDEAQAIFDSLQQKAPLVSAVLAFRRQVEHLSKMAPDTFCPSSPSSFSAAAPASGYRRMSSYDPPVVLSEGAHTEEGDAILKGVELRKDAGGIGGNQTMPVLNVHPAYVVADGERSTRTTSAFCVLCLLVTGVIRMIGLFSDVGWIARVDSSRLDFRSKSMSIARNNPPLPTLTFLYHFTLHNHFTVFFVPQPCSLLSASCGRKTTAAAFA